MLHTRLSDNAGQHMLGQMGVQTDEWILSCLRETSMEARLAWKEPGLFFVLGFAFLMATAVHLPLRLVLRKE